MECRLSSAIQSWWKPDWICWTFPTILFYESGYSLDTLRQASRRSWRIGQRRPVRVKFLCYEGTMQTSCLRLMGKKLLVALTMEGKFAGEGLQSIDEDTDMVSAMARELVERNGIGETADSIWKALSLEHQKLFPTIAHDNLAVSSEELPSVPIEPLFAILLVWPSLRRTLALCSSLDSELNRYQVDADAGGQLCRNKRRYSASVETATVTVHEASVDRARLPCLWCITPLACLGFREPPTA
jgi:hypothetical protein